MRLFHSIKFLHSKRNSQQNEKAIYQNGRKYLQTIYWRGVNIKIYKKLIQLNIKTTTYKPILKWVRGASRWQRSKMWISPSSPQIHQKYIYMWNNSYRTPTERWQKTSDLPKGKKPPHTWVRQKKKTETKE